MAIDKHIPNVEHSHYNIYINKESVCL